MSLLLSAINCYMSRYTSFSPVFLTPVKEEEAAWTCLHFINAICSTPSAPVHLYLSQIMADAAGSYKKEYEFGVFNHSLYFSEITKSDCHWHVKEHSEYSLSSNSLTRWLQKLDNLCSENVRCICVMNRWQPFAIAIVKEPTGKSLIHFFDPSYGDKVHYQTFSHIKQTAEFLKKHRDFGTLEFIYYTPKSVSEWLPSRLPELDSATTKAEWACINVINEIFTRQVPLEDVPSLITQSNKSYKSGYFIGRPGYLKFPKICSLDSTVCEKLDVKNYYELLQSIDQQRVKARTDCICAIRSNSKGSPHSHLYLIAIIDSTARSIIHFFDPNYNFFDPNYNPNERAKKFHYETFNNLQELAQLLSDRHKFLYDDEPIYNSESELYISGP